MKRTTDGDELDRIGRLGENYFEGLCTRAKLKCSTVTPDKTGKDFIVEFPLDPPSFVSFDKRPPPLQIVVQVKTILAKNNRASLSLSVAERLAKDLRPTIVCILKIDDKDDIIDIFFVHLFNKNLARILKSLRHASSKGAAVLSHRSISFKTSPLSRVKLNYVDFYTALATLPAATMTQYAETKARQLENLGFGPDRFNVKFTFADASQDDITDAFLALKSVSVSNFMISERRFDIDMPIEAQMSGRVSFHPQAHAMGTCVVQSDNPHRRVEMDAEFAYVPEWLVGKGNFGISCKTKYGTIILRPGRWTVQNAPFDTNQPHLITEWVEYLELSAIIGGGEFSATFISDEASEPIVMRVSDKAAGYDSAADENYLALFRRLDTVLDAAGRRAQPFKSADALKDMNMIRLVSGLLSEAKATVEVTDLETIPSLLNDERSGFASAVCILGKWYGLYVPLKISTTQSEGQEVRWLGIQSGKAVVEPFTSEDLETAFEGFKMKYSELTSVSAIFVQEPADFATGQFDHQGNRSTFKSHASVDQSQL